MRVEREGEYEVIRYLFVLAVVVLSGCVPQAQIYVATPAVDKSIMVPAGLNSASKAIKTVFRNAGWKTYITGAYVETSGSADEYVNLKTKVSYPGRYSVLVESEVDDICVITMTELIDYDIVIVDNVTGEEVAALEGRLCENDLKRTLRETLKPIL
jgi:hypothetical protein